MNNRQDEFKFIKPRVLVPKEGNSAAVQKAQNQRPIVLPGQNTQKNLAMRLMPAPIAQKPAKRKIARASLVIILILILLISGGVNFYFYKKFRESQKQSQAQAEIAEKRKNESIVEKVGRLMVLPQGEQPEIATISDTGRIKNQFFLGQAKEGFKMLVYTNAKKAILYDPVNDKIVEVSSLDFERGGEGASSTPQ